MEYESELEIDFEHHHDESPQEDTASSGRACKDRWFDPWLCAKGEPLHSLVDEFVAGLEFHTSMTRPRARARRAQDAETYRASVEAIVANLALAVLDPPAEGQRLAVPLRKGDKRNRYENPALSTRFISDAVKMLAEIDAVDLDLGVKGMTTTTVLPTFWFCSRVVAQKVTLEDFGRRENEEVIILKRKHKGEDEGWTFESGAYYEDYIDDDLTLSFRREVQEINHFLECADMRFIDDGQSPAVNTNDRRLRRHFTLFRDSATAFDRTGRLFGGWWLVLKKTRRPNIRLQGEPVAILDYASMFGRLAYAHLGLQAPEHDLYDLSGLLPGYDTRIKDHRDGVKQFFNAMMFGSKGTRMPKGTRALLPKGVKAPQVQQAIIARNPSLACLFGNEVGYKLMFAESQVLLRVLCLLMAENIVALPLHDGLMVAHSCADRGVQAMKKGAEEVTGFSFPVSLKRV